MRVGRPGRAVAQRVRGPRRRGRRAAGGARARHRAGGPRRQRRRLAARRRRGDRRRTGRSACRRRSSPSIVAWIPAARHLDAQVARALGGDRVVRRRRVQRRPHGAARGRPRRRRRRGARVATADRLHQDARFAAFPPSHAALADGLTAGAWCGWLSGSGPTVALLCDPAEGRRRSPPPCPPTATPSSCAIASNGATVGSDPSCSRSAGRSRGQNRRAGRGGGPGREPRRRGRGGVGGRGSAASGGGAGSAPAVEPATRTSTRRAWSITQVTSPRRDLEAPAGAQRLHLPRARLIAPSSADRRSRAVAASSKRWPAASVRHALA